MARVLVVDDEPEAVELLQEFLGAKGYDVSTAGDGAEAVRKVMDERPHLILLDVRMPKMDGLEALRRVREIDKEVGVIMITGVTEEEIGWQAMGAGRVRLHRQALGLAVPGTKLVVQDHDGDAVMLGTQAMPGPGREPMVRHTG